MADTDNSHTSSSTENNDTECDSQLNTPPPILTQQVGHFYQFMFTCMVEWRQLCYVSHEDTDARQALPVPNYVKSVDTSRYRSFLDYWSYRLYHDYGVKRRILKYGGDDIMPSNDDTTDTDATATATDNTDTTITDNADATDTATDVEGSTEVDDATATDVEATATDVEDSTDVENAQSNLYKFYGKSSKLLVQFFYDKALRGYDKHKPITQLCRHMVFDMYSLRIVSLGVTKSFDFDVMAKNIMGTNVNSEVMCNVRLEEFLEGTMVVYNPTLESFGQQSLARHMDVEEAEDQAREDKMKSMTDADKDDDTDTNNVTSSEQKQNRRKCDLEVSTRRKLGTSYFNNPGMTFAEMFKANNAAANVDIQTWPDNFKATHCFVFNIEHEENKIINPSPNNRNTLVAVYNIVDPCVTRGFPSPHSLLEAFMQEDVSQFNTSSEVQQHLGVLMQGLWTYGTACISQVPQQHLSEYITSALGESAKHVRCSQLLTYCDANIREVKQTVYKIIKGQTKHQPGVMVYHILTGARSKIRNSKYTEILALKGNLPITVSERNRRNLFKLYWNLRQRKDGSVGKFLKEFDNESCVYKNIFDWFKSSVHAMTNNLYLEYMVVFVEKTKSAPEIPYEFKPLCGELHKLYLSNRKPTTQHAVINFVNNMPYFQVYWRLFGLQNGQELQYQAAVNEQIDANGNTNDNSNKNTRNYKYRSQYKKNNRWNGKPPMRPVSKNMPIQAVVNTTE